MIKDETVKQEIVFRAQVLFQQYGLKKTTMDEIAQACGKAKSTMYHYFKSKEEVFEEVIKLEVTNLRKEVKNQVDKEKLITDKIRMYFLTFHTAVLDKTNLHNSISLKLQSETNFYMGYNQSKRISTFKSFMDFEREYLTRILVSAFDSGEFRKIDKEDIPFFAETLIAAFFGVMSYSIETDSLKNREKIQKTATLLAHQIFS